MRFMKNFCPVCQSSDDHLLLDARAEVPVLQNTTFASKEEAIQFPRAALEMRRCVKCGFVWNARFDPGTLCYDQGYNNDVSGSGYYQQHLNEMADRVIASVPASEPIHYAEIGCGEGDFLNLIIEKAKGRCVSAMGFDPSFTGQDRLHSSAVVHKSFFTPEACSKLPAECNVICSRHTIEHVADVHEFARALAFSLSIGNRTLFVETPDVNWILKNAAFQDFFYEHCSLFTPHSISRLFEMHGLESSVESVYDGQYMWTKTEKNVAGPLKAPLVTDVEQDALAANYITQRQDMITHWQSYLLSRTDDGPIAIWGAASKGVTFSLMLNDTANGLIEAAIDLNVAKQGRFLPQTGLRVISPEQSRERGVATVVIMNPNYEQEIREMAAQLEWYPQFVTLSNPLAARTIA